MSITEQTIRLKLNNKGIPSDVAEQAAKLIADYADGNIYRTGDSALIDAFVASYQSFPNEALDMLEKSLITGNTSVHIFRPKKR